jgi:hypothetical protein
VFAPAGSERHFIALRRAEAARCDVERPAGEAKRRGWRIGRGRRVDDRYYRRRRGRCNPAQHSPDARQQFAQIEGLGHVIVGADLQPDHLVDSIAAASHDHQSALPSLSHLPRDGDAVFTRQAEVEQHDRRRVLPHQVEQGSAQMALADTKAVDLQIVGQQQGDLGFVVENSDVDGG